MIQERGLLYVVVDSILYLILGLLALSCLLPFLHILSMSFSNHFAVSSNQVGVWPVGFNVDNYRYMLRNDQFLRSFGISTMRVIGGVVTILAVTVVTAYPFSRDHIHMPGRTIFKVVMLFGMLFSGGLIPTFLAYKSLGLIDNFLVLILPPALNIFYVIIMINFLRGIPQELYEAAVMDGATHFDVLLKVFLPVSLPAMATITLFAAVQHWNSWFDGIVFLNRREIWPLQSFLYSLVSTREVQWNIGAGSLQFANATPEGLAAAFIFFASVPIILVYPFLQRYFVTGLTLGSVKE
jgi:putative aldouronate transport system permease protein